METTTPVPAATVEAAPGTPPVETVTTPVTESGNNNAEARIGGLTAERERWKAKAEAYEAEIAATNEANKSEETKRIEERAAELHGADLQRLKKIDEQHTVELDAIIAQIPEDKRGLIAASAPLDERLTQARTALAILQDREIKAPIDSGSNPVTETAKPNISMVEYQRIAALASSHREHEATEFNEKWPAYKAAMIEGRVK